VAREAEFALLTGLWQDVAAGGARVVVIEGEDGGGKTRLAEEFLRWAGQRTPRPVVLEARAFEAEQTRPWVLVRHLLTKLASAPGLGAAPAATLQVLTRLVPEIADRFTSLPPPPPSPPGVPNGSSAEAIARALAEVAVEVPVVMLVDDAHHADPESRELIEALCRHPIDGVLLILATGPNEFPGLLGLERGLAGGELVRITLASLSEAELEQLLAGMADFAPADRRVLSERLYTECSGNPLGAIELVTTLADRGVIAPGPDGLWVLQTGLDSEPLPVPVSILNAVSNRLRQLPVAATRVLEAAAVLGRETDPDTLRDLSGLGPTTLDGALDQLISRRFLRVASDGWARLEFIHEIVRHVVYQGLSPARRQRLHHRAWRALRRGGSPDEVREAAVAHHRARMGLRARRRTLWLAATGILVVLAGGVAGLMDNRSAPPLSPTTVAVLPFSVRGNTDHAYLGEGLVTLLGAALDGLGGLSTADSRSLLSFLGGRPANPERGQSAARHVGAGLFVLGDIVAPADGPFELAASLYDLRGRLQTVARTNAATEAGLYGAVDELAKQLVVNRRAGDAAEIDRVAAATTASLPALKAYLEGERYLREGSFGAAVDAFRRAVSADPAFALAHYRLAIAAEWDQRSVLSERAAQQAVRFGDRLTERARAVVDALLAWRRGELRNGYGHYIAIVNRYPKDTEAWFQLGEVLFHAGPVLGRPVGAAKEAWMQVLDLEPENRFAMVHLARIAAAENDSATLHALVPERPDLEVGGDRRLLELAAWRALVFGSEPEAAWVMGYMRRQGAVVTVVWQLATYSRDLVGSQRFVHYVEREWPNSADRLMLQLELARGKWRTAEARLATVTGFDSVPSLSRAYIASLPFVETPRSELLSLRNELKSWKAPAAPAPPWSQGDHRVVGYHAVVYPQLQRYLLGTLSVRAGDTTGAIRYAGELEQMGRPAHAASLARDLALGLRAMVARSEGRPEVAWQLLELMRPVTTREEIFESPLYSRALERYHRAEVLQELGRGEAALPWLESMAQLSPYELVFLAPSLLRRAEIHERLGRPADAAKLYARFIELWKDADPESQSLVAQARARLAAIRR